MNNTKYIPIIGMEVHVELNTQAKMFCGCSAHHFNVPPNTHTCPVCLGLPGALPVPNKQAIEWCLMMGLALNCQINDYSKFDRKNYFYPDLPKGYQISQYDQPFARNGELKLNIKNQKLKIIRITRVHMEEDTGKLIHDKTDATLVDFNRSGVPLVEIVTEPDIHFSDEAVVYLKKVQQLIRYLRVSDCDMEKGSMRCEVNISLQPAASNRLPKYKVEVKNINSFKFVKKAIEYEINRQAEILDRGELPIQETRGFKETNGKTYSQRTKEEAHDYRYFPEPDIPPFTNIKNQISKIKNKIPELPDQKIIRFTKQYHLPENYIEILTETREKADYFEAATTGDRSLVKKIADLIVNKRIDIIKTKPEEIVVLIKKQSATTISDTTKLETVVTRILAANKSAVADYKKGKQTVMGFLMGQVMKETRGKADPQVMRKILIEKLQSSN